MAVWYVRWSVLGGVLPALGIAMLMNIVIKSKIQLIFFFAGFVLLAFAGLSMIALVFISALVAYLYFIASNKSATTPIKETNSSNSDVFEDDDLF